MISNGETKIENGNRFPLLCRIQHSRGGAGKEDSFHYILWICSIILFFCLLLDTLQGIEKGVEFLVNRGEAMGGFILSPIPYYVSKGSIALSSPLNINGIMCLIA